MIFARKNARILHNLIVSHKYFPRILGGTCPLPVSYAYNVLSAPVYYAGSRVQRHNRDVVARQRRC